MMHLQLSGYRFKPALVPTVICALLFCVLVSLGQWQWQRANYKKELHDRYLQSQQGSPLSIEKVTAIGKDANAFPVIAEGYFDNRHNILLDNQIEGIQAGFQVLTPFTTVQNQTILVSRGWIPLGKDREHFTAIPVLEEKTFLLSGQAYFPSEKQFVLKEDDFTRVEWPLLVQKLDLLKISRVLGVELVPFVIRLDPGVRVETGDQLLRHWQFIVMSSEKSRAYSFQWYGMAFVLCCMYVFFSIEKTGKRKINGHG